MKKITLIACAALVAGLLVSCNNATEAGTIDYDSVRNTANVNSYSVSGTMTQTVYNETGSYNDKDEQTAGTKSTVVNTMRIVSAAALVSYETDSVTETNWQRYAIAIDESKGKASDSTETSTWSSSGWGTPSTTTHNEPTGDPTTTIPRMGIKVFIADGKVYFENDFGVFEGGEIDEEAIAAGEDFTLSFTGEVETLDMADPNNPIQRNSSNVTHYNSAGNQTSRNVDIWKTTVAFNLTFTAK